MDEFTEVTSTGWLGRVGESIKGILIGIVLFGAAFPLTWWNEGRAVTRTRSLEEGAAAMITGDVSRVDSGNEGKLVYVAGNVEVVAPLEDDYFDVKVDALSVKRKVEMFQWKENEKREEKKKLGGGKETVTTYSYSLGWDDDVIDSARFRQASSHQNPNSMPVHSTRFDAKNAKLGAFTLDESMTTRLSGWTPLDVTAGHERFGFKHQVIPNGAVSSARGLYRGSDPDNPQVGDIRVTFEQIVPGPFSFIAKQTGTGLHEYATQAGSPILLVETGIQPAQSMFKKAHDANTLLTWLLRAAGLFVMTLGLSLVLRPLSTVLDVVPLLGNVAEMGIFLVSGLVSLVLTAMTIGAAWMFYRPLVGIAMLIAAVGAVVMLKKRKDAAPARVAAMPPPPPPA